MALTVNVTEPELLMEVEERLALSPPPFTLKLTVPLNPLTGETVMVEVALPGDAAIDNKLGDAVRVKSGGGGGAFTVRETPVLCTSMPLTALIVRLLVPVGVDEVVQTFKVELPAPVTEAGVKVAVAFDGTPLTLNDTVLLKPLTSAEIDAV